MGAAQARQNDRDLRDPGAASLVASHARLSLDAPRPVAEDSPAALAEGSSADCAPADVAPHFIGRYKVTRFIGEGTMGTIFAAVHPDIGKRVAIKVLRPGLEAHTELVERFMLEARSVNRVDHPNIINVFDFGRDDDGRPFMVMELLEGETLEERIEREELLSIDEALPILRQVASAMDAAHEHGIVHRDLKPENVFLVNSETSDVHVKLLDFGLAKLIDGDQRAATQAGHLLGTPLYMAPEQCRGQAVDARTDSYAFGVLAFRTLTGNMPITGDSVGDVLMHHVSMPPVLASQFGAPPAVDAVFGQLLQKLPSNRPDNLSAVVSQLTVCWPSDTRLNSGDESQDNSDEVVRCPGHTGGITDLALSPDGTVLVAAGRDGAMRMWNWDGSAVRRVPAHRRAIERLVFSADGARVATLGKDRLVRIWTKDGELEREIPAVGGVTDLTFFRDGATVAWTSRDGQTTTVRQSAEPHRVRGHFAAARAIASSPVSNMFATASDDRTVRLWDPSSGRRRSLRGHTRSVRALVFSPNGRHVAAAGLDGTVWQWSVSEGDNFVYRGGPGTLTCLAYSPDGTQIAAGGADGTVYVWNQQSAIPLKLTGHRRRIRSLAFAPDSGRLASCSNDTTVRLWNPSSGTCETIISHSAPARCAVFSPDGTMVATASGGSSLNITRIRLRQPEAQLQGPETPVLRALPPAASLGLRDPEPHVIRAHTRSHPVPKMQRSELWFFAAAAGITAAIGSLWLYLAS